MKKNGVKISRPSIETLRRGRRVTAEQHRRYSKALDDQFGLDRPRLKPGPKPDPAARFIPTHIKLNPIGLHWAKKTAKKLGIGYQTVINRLLVKKANSPSPRWSI